MSNLAEKLSIRVIGARVLLKKVETEQGNASLILLESSKKECQCYVVVGVGNPSEVDPSKKQNIPVKVGDKVVIEQYASCSFELSNEEEYFIVDVDKIIAVLTN